MSLELYHVGYVVSDLSDAMDRLGRRLGLRWTDVVRVDGAFVGPAGASAVSMELVYSTNGGAKTELIQELPGTLWDLQATSARRRDSTGVAADDIALHHLGYWTDRLAHDSDDLARRGHPRLMTAGKDVARPRVMAYHTGDGGVHTELVDAAARDAFETWFAGGPFPL